MTVDKLHRVVKTEMRSKIRDENASSQIRSLLLAYHFMLCKQSVSCVIEDNPKLLFRYFISTVLPEALRKRLGSVLSFVRKHLMK